MRLFVITGPSGIGKSHLQNELINNGLHIVKRYSTRAKRQDDISTDMIHLTVDEYKEMELRGDFLVSEQFGGNWYGFSKNEIYSENNAKAKAVIVWPEIVNQFMVYSDAVPIYLDIDENNEELLIKRMRVRGDSEEVINKRMDLAQIARQTINREKDMYEQKGKIFVIKNDRTLYDKVLPWMLENV